MALVVGKEYYWLTADEYNDLKSIYDGPDGLIDDFEKGADGFYYADPADIVGDEDDFLLENDWLKMTYYSTSTQPGGGM